MRFVFNDGGRQAAGYSGRVSNCALRSVCIAMELDYKATYKELSQHFDESPRKGLPMKKVKEWILSKGWKWKAIMGFGTGTTIHLHDAELPKGRLICRVSKHLCAIIDGVLHDTHDCTRHGKRCVYGYFYKEEL